MIISRLLPYFWIEVNRFMRKIIFILLSVLIIFNMSAVALEESNISIVDIFCDGNRLDIYMTLSENMQEDMQHSQFNVNISIPGSLARPVLEQNGKVSQGFTPTFTILLLDISRSMAPFRDDAIEYILQIMEDAHSQAHFLLASFGNDFNMLIDENADSKAEIDEVLQDLEFDDGQTNLYKAIVDAVDYAENLRENMDALVNVLVITDGIDASVRAVSEADVIRKLENSRIVVHTMQICDSIEQDYTDKLRNFADISGGFFIIYISGRDRTIANEFNYYLSNIYFASFDISSLNLDIAAEKLTGTIYFTVGGGGVTDYRQNFEIGGDNAPEEAPPAESGPVVRPIAPPAGDESEENQIEDEEASEAEIESRDGEPARTNNRSGSRLIFIIAIIVGAILLVIIIVAAAVSINKQSGGKAGSAKDGIYMKLDVISGQCRTKSREFYLKNELIIGKNPKCDIIFSDPEISDRNSRIFIGGNMIYIEDLGSVNGTAISGMKIFAHNRLRGGDIISIGNVSFSLKF